LIESQETFNLDDLKRIKFDRTYPQAGSIMRTWKCVLAIPAEKYPDIKEAIQFLQTWNLTGDSTNTQAALAMIAMRYAWFGLGYAYVELEEGHEVPEKIMVESIRKAVKYLEKHHKTYKIPLGQVQQLMRLDKKYAVSGLPESLRAIYGSPDKNGKIKVEGGDTFIMFVRWKNGQLEAESVVPFGSSNRKDSIHYTDQMELYAKEKFKPVIFDKETLLKNGGKISYPE
jgi:acyl-homoserine-lactone acylase